MIRFDTLEEPQDLSTMDMEKTSETIISEVYAYLQNYFP